MKVSGALLASIIAASSFAFSASIDQRQISVLSSSQHERSGSSSGRSAAGSASRDQEKFAPRFDGLRFIETLVTAHR
ncbi:hypothetical protein ACLOJK_032022 [Asimina triloba]